MATTQPSSMLLPRADAARAPASPARVVIISRNVFSTRFGGAFNIRRQVAVLAALGYHVTVIHDDPVSPEFAAEISAAGVVEFKQSAPFFDLSMKRFARYGRVFAHRAAMREIDHLLDRLAPHAIMVHGERPLPYYLRLQ